jgi:CheY-like chemotaxis protein
MPARILVIEDNPDNLALAVYLLEAAGYNTIEARDGAQGVRAAREALPDLIVCDLQMPVLNGFEVLQHLRVDPATRSIPVVAVTAFSMPSDRARVEAAGFDGYLSKPIDPEHFAQQVACHFPAQPRNPSGSG